jgi:hypothetical protein
MNVIKNQFDRFYVYSYVNCTNNLTEIQVVYLD